MMRLQKWGVISGLVAGLLAGASMADQLDPQTGQYQITARPTLLSLLPTPIVTAPEQASALANVPLKLRSDPPHRRFPEP